MIQINNCKELVQNGITPQIRNYRSLTLQCIEHVVNAVEPRHLIKQKINIENDQLHVDRYSFDLNKFKRFYVVGGGKAGSKMAQAMEELLGRHLTEGTINIPCGTIQKTRCIELNEVSHPIPNEAGVKGTLRIMDIAQKAEKDDLVICLISGGGSSLMPLPREGISLKDKQVLTNMLLKSGASINEINCVRKHISSFKGGWLAKKAFPATVLNLILSDVMGDSLDSIASGPTVSDPTTFEDAEKILEKYSLWSNAPKSIRKIISEGVRGLIEETPKANDVAFSNVYSVIIGNNRTATLAAIDFLNSKRVNALLLADALTGEARDTASALAKFANNAFDCLAHTSKPLAIVAGGETIVTVKAEGLGGRNQEMALSAALNLKSGDCVFASFSTDGIDGPTDAAGAIVDSQTLKKAKKLGLNPEQYLADNDSYHFFLELNDLINTQATGTNVNDISLFIGWKNENQT
jgi:glycerate 2-kinase